MTIAGSWHCRGVESQQTLEYGCQKGLVSIMPSCNPSKIYCSISDKAKPFQIGEFFGTMEIEIDKDHCKWPSGQSTRSSHTRLRTSDLELRLESNSLSELHPAWGKKVIYYKSNV
jgi:hypothetical protein